MSQDCERFSGGDGLGSRRAWFRRPLSFMLLVFSCVVASFTCTCMAHHVPDLIRNPAQHAYNLLASKLSLCSPPGHDDAQCVQHKSSGRQTNC